MELVNGLFGRYLENKQSPLFGKQLRNLPGLPCFILPVGAVDSILIWNVLPICLGAVSLSNAKYVGCRPRGGRNRPKARESHEHADSGCKGVTLGGTRQPAGPCQHQDLGRETHPTSFLLPGTLRGSRMNSSGCGNGWTGPREASSVFSVVSAKLDLFVLYDKYWARIKVRFPFSSFVFSLSLLHLPF